MAAISIDRTELVWPGKYNDDGTLKEVPRVSLPFQVIETVNESRATREARKDTGMPLFDEWEGNEGDSFEEGWRNKLIWGDNLLVMGSLLKRFAGKIDLIYIDPPFATGIDYSVKMFVGDVQIDHRKQHSVLEEKAYRDTWGAGLASYVSMLQPRLHLMRQLLSDRGTICIHIDYRLLHYVGLILADTMGASKFRNNIVWSYGGRGGKAVSAQFPRNHDVILMYAKSDNAIYNRVHAETEHHVDKLPSHIKLDDKGRPFKTSPRGNYTDESIRRLEAEDRIYRTRTGTIRIKYPLERRGAYAIEESLVGDVWTDIPDMMHAPGSERLGYPTQKPEALLRRIVAAASHPNSIVADVFCGSGTTLAVAEKLGRRWIGCDLSRFGVHTARKRLLDVEDCRPFELLNLGKYERQYWSGVSFGEDQGAKGYLDYVAFILKLYAARPLPGMTYLHGRRGGSMVYVGAVDAPVTISETQSAVGECTQLGQSRLHILGWEWEMGLQGLMVAEAKKLNVALRLLQIPREVMEKQAVDRGDITFFELAYVETNVEYIVTRQQNGGGGGGAANPHSPHGFCGTQPGTHPRRCTQQGKAVVRLRRLLGGGLGLRQRHVHAGMGGLSHAEGAHVAVAFRHARIRKARQVPRARQGHRHLRERHVPDRGCGDSVGMAQALVGYDEELPEVPGRRPWERPTRHLVKDGPGPTVWSVAEGRRESTLLLVPRIRDEVDTWRDKGYPGASDVTARLFEYWFEEDHDVSGFPRPLRYYFCQREAIETLAWLVEIADAKDAVALVNTYGTRYDDGGQNLLSRAFDIHTRPDGSRLLHRYVPESEAPRQQDLPPKDLRRYAFKMATGSGKTWVMAMAVVWSYFHSRKVEDSEMSSNFLIVSPNVIVHQRLEKDFADRRSFHDLPLIPPEWHDGFSLKVVLRRETTEPDPSGNLFLTNIQQLYDHFDKPWAPENPVDAVLGPKPAKDLAASGQRSMLERVKSLKDVLVINDEAHHVHDDELKWNQALLDIREALPGGISAWLDFTATPKDQNGMFFPWTVCDYPLAQAVEDQIVKAPIIVKQRNKDEPPPDDPDRVTKKNVVERYEYWIRAAVARWREHAAAYEKLDPNPVLFVMAEKSAYADAIADHLRSDPDLGFKASEVLVIHTSAKGEISKKDLDIARRAARDIDSAKSPIKAIVSVMMLREGWDVRNVTVVLGLRPYTAKSQILPEQVIGRGLRLMTGVGPERRQTLEVLGTRNLLKVLRDQLEQEGVGVAEVKEGPPRPITIEPLHERIEYDIAIPITKPRLERDMRRLSDLDPQTLEPIYDQEELDEAHRIQLEMAFAAPEVEVHQADISVGEAPARELLAAICREVTKKAALPGEFAEMYPIVRDYVRDRCFGGTVDLDDTKVRSHLGRVKLRLGIAKYIARVIGALTTVRQPVSFRDAQHRLSDTRPFSWRRDLQSAEPRGCVAAKTVFNYVATYNGFERVFAGFLDQAADVVRFAALGTTEQGTTGTQFRVDYLKRGSGAIGFYHPDWVVVQRMEEGEVHWIIETKGRVWADTEAKDEAMESWCARVTEASDMIWRYHRVNQSEFESRQGRLLADLVDAHDLDL